MEGFKILILSKITAGARDSVRARCTDVENPQNKEISMHYGRTTRPRNGVCAVVLTDFDRDEDSYWFCTLTDYAGRQVTSYSRQ